MSRWYQEGLVSALPDQDIHVDVSTSAWDVINLARLAQQRPAIPVNHQKACLLWPQQLIPRVQSTQPAVSRWTRRRRHVGSRWETRGFPALRTRASRECAISRGRGGLVRQLRCRLVLPLRGTMPKIVSARRPHFGLAALSHDQPNGQAA